MILASNSPQRKDLMKYITNEIEYMSVETDESFLEDLDIYENIMEVAKNKALAVIEKYKVNNEIVIGADTIVYSNGKILLKPKSYDEAFNMIKSYKNNKMEVISGVCIAFVKNNEVSFKTFTESSFVKFSNITDDKIKQWLAQDNYLGCSGAIKIEKVEKLFDTKIEGSITNIIGLPIEHLSKELFHLEDNRFKDLFIDKNFDNRIRVRSASRVLPMKEGKVFFLKQKNQEGEYGYCLIGGGCMIDEDLLIGGQREVLEETGFLVNKLNPIGRAIIHKVNKEESEYGIVDEAMYYQYFSFGEIVDITESSRLEYEKEIIDSVVEMSINDAINLFKEQSEKWINIENNFFYWFNLGVVEMLEELKQVIEY